MLKEQDAEKFITTYLSLPPGSTEHGSPPPPNSPEEQAIYALRSVGQHAKAGTIQFLKRSTLPHQQVHALSFEDEAGQGWDYFCEIAQNEQGYWQLLASASIVWGSMRRPSHTFPWVHLVGGSGENGLWIGGYVTDTALDAQRVRVITRDGLTLEDTVQNRLILFQITQQVEIPVQVEVYANTDRLIGQQTFLDYARGRP